VTFEVVKGRAAIPLIAAVRANADSDKVALGFIPESAYTQAAASGKPLVVISESSATPETIGHLLYGGTFPHIHVYQVYVTPPNRGCLNDLGVPAWNHVVGLRRVEIGADREFKLRKCG